MIFRKISSTAFFLLFFINFLTVPQVVEKESASFEFPTTVTSTSQKPAQTNSIKSFSLSSGGTGGEFIEFEWSVSSSKTGGIISIYNLSGSLIKSKSLYLTHGIWKCSLKNEAAGVYLAEISISGQKRSLKFTLIKN